MKGINYRVTALYLLLLAGLLNFSHCDVFDKESKVQDPLEEIMEHVEQFKKEATQRGFKLDAKVDALEISVQKRLVVDDEEYCGYVPLTPAGLYSNHVMFATNSGCWGDLSRWSHEVLVFHELGHAILDRAHNEDMFPNGAWVSIMKRRTGFGYTLYGDSNLERREYYIDELFDENTPAPEWAQQ